MGWTFKLRLGVNCASASLTSRPAFRAEEGSRSAGGSSPDAPLPSAGASLPAEAKQTYRGYSRSPENPALQQLQKSSKSASMTPQSRDVGR